MCLHGSCASPSCFCSLLAGFLFILMLSLMLGLMLGLMSSLCLMFTVSPLSAEVAVSLVYCVLLSMCDYCICAPLNVKSAMPLIALLVQCVTTVVYHTSNYVGLLIVKQCGYAPQKINAPLLCKPFKCST